MLKNYQKECVEFIHKKKFALITMDRQTGKTLTSLKAIENKDRTLILTPNKTIAKKWENEIKNFNINFEGEISTFGTFAGGEFDNIIIDEFHKITAKTSQRYKKLKKQFKNNDFKMIILLTATPIRQTQTELYFGLSIFGEKFPLMKKYKLKKDFEEHFFDYEQGFNGYFRKYMPMPTKFKVDKTEELNELCNVFNFEHQDKNIEEFVINFDKKNMDVYNYLFKHNCYPTKEILNTYEAGTKHIQLLQLANSHSISTGITDNDYKLKTDYIIKVLKKYNKIICFYHFDIEKDIIKTELEKHGFACGFDKDVFEGYKKESELNCVLAQSSNCEGWTLTDRHIMIFFNFGYSGTSYHQAKGRFLSADFEKFIYVDLLMENTIENERLKVLNKKITMNELFKRIGEK